MFGTLRNLHRELQRDGLLPKAKVGGGSGSVEVDAQFVVTLFLALGGANAKEAGGAVERFGRLRCTNHRDGVEASLRDDIERLLLYFHDVDEDFDGSEITGPHTTFFSDDKCPYVELVFHRDDDEPGRDSRLIYRNIGPREEVMLGPITKAVRVEGNVLAAFARALWPTGEDD